MHLMLFTIQCTNQQWNMCLVSIFWMQLNCILFRNCPFLELLTNVALLRQHPETSCLVPPILLDGSSFCWTQKLEQNMLHNFSNFEEALIPSVENYSRWYTPGHNFKLDCEDQLWKIQIKTNLLLTFVSWRLSSNIYTVFNLIVLHLIRRLHYPTQHSD